MNNTTLPLNHWHAPSTFTFQHKLHIKYKRDYNTSFYFSIKFPWIQYILWILFLLLLIFIQLLQITHNFQLIHITLIFISNFFSNIFITYEQVTCVTTPPKRTSKKNFPLLGLFLHWYEILWLWQPHKCSARVFTDEDDMDGILVEFVFEDNIETKQKVWGRKSLVLKLFYVFY